jgi:Domain of Unknown Function (DUF748)
MTAPAIRNPLSLFKKIRMLRGWRRVALWFAIIAFTLPLLLAALLYFAIPYAMTSYAPKWVKEKTGRELRVGEATFNPFKLDLSVRDFALLDGGKPLARFDRLDIEGSWSSVGHWAFATDRIALRKPQIDARIGKDGTLDWARFLDALPKSAEEKSASDTIPRMVLRNIEIVDAAIRLIDERMAGDSRNVELEPLSLKLEKLSTLPQDRGDYSLDATLNDQTRVQWRGRVGLNPIESSGDLLVTNLPIAKTLNIAGVTLPVHIDGTAKFRTNYGAAAGTDFLAAGVGGGALDFADVVIKEKKTKSVDSASANNASSGSDIDSATIKSIALTPLSFSWVRRKGEISGAPANAYALQPLAASIGAISVNASNSKAPMLALERIVVDPITVDVVTQKVDASRIAIAGVQANIERDRRGEVLLPFTNVSSDETAKSSAVETQSKVVATASTKRNDWRFNVGEISTERATVNVRDASFVSTQRGALKLDASFGVVYEMGAKSSAQILVKTLRASDISLRDDASGNAAPWFTTKEVRSPAFTFDALGAKFEFPKIEIVSPQVIASMDKSGIDLAVKLTPIVATSDTTSAPVKRSTDAMSPKVSLAGVVLTGGRASLTDKTLATPITHTLDKIAATTERIELDWTRPIVARMTAALASGGDLKSNVKFDQRRGEGDIDVSADKVALIAFSPYLNQNTRLKLTKGEFASTAKVKFATAAKAAEPWRVDATAKLSGVELLDETTQAPFATWGELSSTDIKVRAGVNGSGVDIVLGDLLLEDQVDYRRGWFDQSGPDCQSKCDLATVIHRFAVTRITDFNCAIEQIHQRENCALASHSGRSRIRRSLAASAIRHSDFRSVGFGCGHFNRSDVACGSVARRQGRSIWIGSFVGHVGAAWRNRIHQSQSHFSQSGNGKPHALLWQICRPGH